MDPDREPTPSAVSTTGPVMVPARRLRVVVGSLPIGDGSTDPPAVGEIGTYRLTFHETGPIDGGADGPAGWLSAMAEPVGDGSPLGPGRQWDGTPNEGPTTWPTLLRGDGWSAHWRAPRPVVGRVRVHGRLGDHLDIDARTDVRGLVTRVRVITETLGTWVLVDLDLDHVPPLPPRPVIVPAALAAHGPDLWVLDARLPLLLRIHRPLDPDPAVTEHRWDGRILTAEEAGHRHLHADATGCWITGPDGTHRATDGGVHQIDGAPVGLAAASTATPLSPGTTLAVQVPATSRSWSCARHPTTGTPSEVDTPAVVHDLVRSGPSATGSHASSSHARGGVNAHASGHPRREGRSARPPGGIHDLL